MTKRESEDFNSNRGIGRILRDAAGNGSAQVFRNLIVQGKRTSIRMEQMYWDTLKAIANLEKVNENDIIELVAGGRIHKQNLTAAVRVFCIAYFNHRMLNEHTSDGFTSALEGALQATTDENGNRH